MSEKRTLSRKASFNEKMKAYLGLGILQAIIGLGALGGGLMLVIDPSGSTLKISENNSMIHFI